MIDLKRVNARLAHFQSDLSRLQVPLIVQKHITFGDCFILDESQHFQLKSEISQHFGIHHSEVMVVGSGKLGFSIADGKRYTRFGDQSDIDVAIASGRLFDDLWQQIFDYWSMNGTLGTHDRWFKSCLFRGWIRPDLLPTAPSLPARQHWWDIFLGLTHSEAFGPYKVRGGLYKSPHFLEKYQAIMVQRCKEELR